MLAYADDVVAHFGTVNQVYNNAGIAFTGDVEDSPFKDIERVMDVDFWGVVNGTKAFLPHLIASGDGHVVNISSLFGLISVPGQSAYNAAKFAVRGFTEALRQEMLARQAPGEGDLRAPGRHQDRHRPQRRRRSRAATTTELAEFVRQAGSHHRPRRPPTIILKGVRKGKARVLIGADAKALDMFVRLTGSGYQRAITAFSKRSGL